jgi:hypothetical protein
VAPTSATIKSFSPASRPPALAAGSVHEVPVPHWNFHKPTV